MELAEFMTRMAAKLECSINASLCSRYSFHHTHVLHDRIVHVTFTVGQHHSLMSSYIISIAVMKWG